MERRDKLHAELLNFCPHAYFQPPSTVKMSYPCIVYKKSGKDREFANDGVYTSRQEYNLTVIEYDPDSDVADNIEGHYQYCGIQQYYTVDNLNHTTLSLYY